MKDLPVSFIITLSLVSVNANEFHLRTSAYDYHRQFGIKEAINIKKIEDNLILSYRKRVVGGSPTSIDKIPYQAGILISSDNATSVCGGSLISNIYVVTAAHCRYDGVTNSQAFTIVLGSNYLFYGGFRINTDSIITHPNWDPNNIIHDIAMARIKKIIFNDVVQPISLPSYNAIKERFFGYIGTVSGFGKTSSDIQININQSLNWIHVPVISNIECQWIYGDYVADTHICTNGLGGVSPCPGDSGGPLTVNIDGTTILIGVVSFGPSSGCADGFPGAYTRITSYLPWMTSVMSDYMEDKKQTIALRK